MFFIVLSWDKGAQYLSDLRRVKKKKAQKSKEKNGQKSKKKRGTLGEILRGWKSAPP